MKTEEIFVTNNSIMDEFVRNYEYPYEALPHIKEAIVEVGSKLGSDYREVSENVWIHKTAKVHPSCTIGAPAIIDEGTELRCGAFVRGSAVIGKNAVLGNSCEIKNSILYDGVQVPHFNYVGDSILGYRAHMGAGSIASNLKSDKKNIVIKCGDEKYETGLRKMGAILGDNVEIGCNSVLNPGTVISHDSRVYPLTMCRGYIGSNLIVKSMDNIVERKDI